MLQLMTRLLLSLFMAYVAVVAFVAVVNNFAADGVIAAVVVDVYIITYVAAASIAHIYLGLLLLLLLPLLLLMLLPLFVL